MCNAIMSTDTDTDTDTDTEPDETFALVECVTFWILFNSTYRHGIQHGIEQRARKQEETAGGGAGRRGIVHTFRIKPK